MGVAVYAIHDERAAPALSSRFWSRTFLWDFSRSAEQSIAFILDVGRRIGSSVLLMPTSDSLTVFVAQHAHTLQKAFIFPFVSVDLVKMLSNKREMSVLAGSRGIPTPKTMFPQSNVSAVLDEVLLPVMLKGMDPLKPGGKFNAIVRSRDDLLRRLTALGEGASANLLLQEYIPGGEESLWMFNGYFDRRGECLAAFTGRKIRQWPPYHGVTSLGVCAPNPKIEGVTRDFLSSLGYHGIVDVGYRYDTRDGQYKLLDVNPRLGATFRLFVAPTGVDVVRAFYLDMTGQQVPETLLQEGRKWLLEEDFFSFRQYLRDGRLTIWQWMRSLLGVRETAWFASDDPVPFLIWIVQRLGLGSKPVKVRRDG